MRKEQRTLSSKDPHDPSYRRLWYVRYADDFLLGFIGSTQEAEQIKCQIKGWLREYLKLDLSNEKTLVTSATSGAARFLGYEIVNQQSQTKCTNGQRSANGRIGLRVPATVIEKRCQPYLRGGKPIHLPEREVESDYSIVLGYQQEYRGIVQYYLPATNACHLGKLRWVMEVSLLKTPAGKHRSRVRAMAAKYRATTVGSDGKSRHCLEVHLDRDGKPPLKTRFGGFLYNDRSTPLLMTDHYLRMSTTRNSNEEFELMHVSLAARRQWSRRITSASWMTLRGGRQEPAWRKHMMAIQRKTLVLCSACHHKLHAGQFDNNFGMRH